MRPGKTCTNVKKAQEAFGNLQEKETMISFCIDDCNHNMGGVDIADSMCSYYDTQLTSFRTWWLILFSVYDTMVTHAYFIYQDIPQSSNTIKHKEFGLQCIWGSILTGSGQISTSLNRLSARAKSTRANFKASTSSPLDQRWDYGHLPVHHEDGKRLGCWLCCWKQRHSPI